jgi:hypothetical protein
MLDNATRSSKTGILLAFYDINDFLFGKFWFELKYEMKYPNWFNAYWWYLVIICKFIYTFMYKKKVFLS